MAHATSPEDDNHSAPSVDDVRLALAHFFELAAAYEGVGVDAVGGDRKADAETLAAVTQALLKHRAKQRAQQRDVAQASALRLLTEAYRAAKQQSQHDLQAQIIKTFDDFGLAVTDDELDKLVIFYEQDNESTKTAAISRSNGFTKTGDSADAYEITIKGEGGPADAAKTT